jgi:hypothetical protein
MQSAPALIRVLGRAARSAGKALDELGLGLSPHVTRDTRAYTQGATNPPPLPTTSALRPFTPRPPPLFSLSTPSPVVPSTRVVPMRGRELAHGKAAFVASSATVVGDVQIGEHSSVWYGAVVRGASWQQREVGAGRGGLWR